MTTPTIDLPGPIFAKLAPHPYQLRALSRGARTNGRTTQEPRALSVNTSPLSHAHGSALVRLGDTTVLCGVRGEILPVEQIPQFRPLSGEEEGEEEYLEGEYGGPGGIGRGELRDYDLLVPNIELATGSAPQFLPGVPPTALAQTLSTRVYSLLHAAGLVQAGDLRVWYRPGKGEKKKEEEEGGMEVDQVVREEEREEEEQDRVVAYWVLYIDLLFLSYDGNPFDAAWAAAVAALRDTKLPVARWDPDREMVVCSRKEEKKLNIKGLPVACSAAVFMEKEQSGAITVAGDGRNWILLDPDRLEETLCKEMITVVVDCSGGETSVKSLEKQGGTVLGRELIRGFVGVAEERWAEVQKAMK